MRSRVRSQIHNRREPRLSTYFIPTLVLGNPHLLAKPPYLFRVIVAEKGFRNRPSRKPRVFPDIWQARSRVGLHLLLGMGMFPLPKDTLRSQIANSKHRTEWEHELARLAQKVGVRWTRQRKPAKKS